MARDLQHVLDGVLDGVLVLDADGRVELLNAEACRILEASGESVLGSSVDEAFGASHPLARIARAAIEDARPVVDAERALLHRYDEDLVVDVAASPLFESGRVPNGVVVVLRDRTVQNSLRKAAAERDNLEAFGRIAAGIAHEVKNPLGGIRGAAEILAGRAEDPKTKDTAALIVREVDRISSFVEDVMVFARGESLQLELVNVHRILDEVLELLAMDPLGEKAAFERVYDPSIPEFEADPGRLAQVFLNLARNGLQALEGRAGALTVTTRMPVNQHLTPGSGRPVPAVVVDFTDTGAGIPADLLPRVSTPFFTTRPTGIGLGLALSQFWVTRHDGTLRLESERGRGTTASVALPLRRPS